MPKSCKGGGEKKSLRIINGRCSFRLFGIVLQSVNENSIMKIRFFEKGVKEGRRPSGDGRKGMEMIVLTVGGLPVYLFGCIVTGGILAELLAARWGARLYGAPFAVAVDILLASLPLGLIGARVGYILLHWGDFAGDVGRIGRFWEGGYSLYGAGLGLLLAVSWVARRALVSPWRWLDILTPALTLLLTIYAFSTFCLQIVVGAPLPVNLPNDRTLAEYVEFGYRPSGFEGYGYFKPVALYQTGLYGLLFAGAVRASILAAHTPQRRPGRIFLLTVFGAAIIRFVSGFFYLSTVPGLHRGQILALAVAVASLAVFWQRGQRFPVGNREEGSGDGK